MGALTVGLTIIIDFHGVFLGFFKFIILRDGGKAATHTDNVDTCFALAGSVFFILADSAAGDGDGIAVYGTTRLKGCFLLCKGSEL